MNENFWLDILKTQGIATVLIFAALFIVWKWVMPEWKRQAVEKSQLERKRLEAEDKHRQTLLEDLRATREEHRQERQAMAQAHREDTKTQYQIFTGMVDRITSSLDSQRVEIARNSALTVATAEALGADKMSVVHRAEALSGQKIDMDTQEVL